MQIKTFFLALMIQVTVFSQNFKDLVIGATPVPHTEILEAAKPLLLKSGIQLDVKVFTDYMTPDIALADGSIDANYFQHYPYLENFNKNKGTTLESAGSIHFEPLGIYSRKIKSLNELKNGDKVAIPSDATNEARALLLLENTGILKLKKNNLNVSIKDIASKSIKIEVVEIEAAQIPRVLSGVSIAVINGNYAIDAGLNPRTDAIVTESDSSDAANTYANIIAVRKGESNRLEIRKLIEILKSEEIRKFILQRYKNAVIPLQ